MDVKVYPGKLSGKVHIPSSKSIGHRALIAASLADGNSKIYGVDFSKDIIATVEAMRALGAFIDAEKTYLKVRGIAVPKFSATIDANESGSTLRFLIPVAAALGTETLFLGRGRLPKRPITAYLRELPKKGIKMDYDGGLPLRISGKMQSGEFVLEGDVSSQYITGLLFALPICDGNSKIILSSPLQSAPYVALTIRVLNKFGIKIDKTDYGYFIKGNQSYNPGDIEVEGDYSQAAFYYVANENGSNIELGNLFPDSIQGDKAITQIIKDWHEKKISGGKLSFDLDTENIPDLVPILAVLATSGNDTSYIRGTDRLRIKESDRIQSTCDMINSLGGKCTATNDGLIITPVGQLNGGTVDSYGDHRIAMAATIAALNCRNPVNIMDAGVVEKSYPRFFEDIIELGGKVDGITLE